LKPNQQSELKFVLCYMKSGAYGDRECLKFSYDVKEYVRKYLFRKAKKAYLAVMCSIDGHYIPAIDIDSQKDLCIVSLWLKENKLEYSVIESSPKHYWVFPDLVFTSKSKNFEFVASVPKNDENYVKFLIEQPPVIRGFLRHENTRFIPRVVTRDAKNPIINKFIDKLIKHFNSDEVEWMRRYQIYQSNANIADPDFGRELNITVQDMLGTADLEPKTSLLRRILSLPIKLLNTNMQESGFIPVAAIVGIILVVYILIYGAVQLGAKP